MLKKMEKMHSQVSCAALLVIHAFTGYDRTVLIKRKAIGLPAKKENCERVDWVANGKLAMICYRLFWSLHMLYMVSHAWQM